MRLRLPVIVAVGLAVMVTAALYAAYRLIDPLPTLASVDPASPSRLDRRGQARIGALTIRPTEQHTESQHDYDVLDDGVMIGRIYSGSDTANKTQWHYTIEGWGRETANDLQDAKRKFWRTLEQVQGKP